MILKLLCLYTVPYTTVAVKLWGLEANNSSWLHVQLKDMWATSAASYDISWSSFKDLDCYFELRLTMMPTCELQVVPLKHHSAPNSPLKESLFALACTLYMYLNFIAVFSTINNRAAPYQFYSNEFLIFKHCYLLI